MFSLSNKKTRNDNKITRKMRMFYWKEVIILFDFKILKSLINYCIKKGKEKNRKINDISPTFKLKLNILKCKN